MTKRVLITGSRNWEDKKMIHAALDAEYEPGAILVSGACPTGADAIAEDYWGDELHGEVELHPADWAKYGRSAGPLRNAEMVNLGADICLAFIRNNSRGALGTVRLAQVARIPVNLFISGAEQNEEKSNESR